MFAYPAYSCSASSVSSAHVSLTGAPKRSNMRVSRIARLVGLCLCLNGAASAASCTSQDSGVGSAGNGRRDSLAAARAAVVADLEERIRFLLSTARNPPNVSVYGGSPSESTLTISIGNDTNYSAPRLVLDSPTLVRELWDVGYRAVSFPDSGSRRTMILPLRDPSASAASMATAPAGAAGALARRDFADTVAAQLRAIGADARARGADRQILYLTGLRGSASVALNYATAVSGGMLAMDHLRALRFTRLVVAAGGQSWCWDTTEPSGPAACSLADF